MHSINYFPALGYEILSSILNLTGNRSQLSRVCKLFNNVCTAEAIGLYKQITKTFGAACLSEAFRTLKQNDKSLPAKLDALFNYSAKAKKTETICYNNISDVASYLFPLMEAHGLKKLFKAFNKARKEDLSTKHISPNSLLENVEGIQLNFAMNLEKLVQITRLFLNAKEIRILPAEIALFKNLKVLDLSKNSMLILPREIGCLSKLATLKLAQNCLSSLPSEMKGMSSLMYLGLESNQFSTFPAIIESIPHLKGLYLYANQIAEIPESFCNSSQLKYFAAQNNILTHLPESIGKMSGLRSLLVDYNRIKKLPESIGSLTGLECLSFSNNEVSGLPYRMGQITQLRHLNYQGNSIKEIPFSAKSLNFWSLNPSFYPFVEEGKVEAILNKSLSLESFKGSYWGLGLEKWMECIDGIHHSKGPSVYDEGLHGGSVEPGFLLNIQLACLFLSNNFNQVINADFYLEVHKVACKHFNGEKTCTLMGQEGIGSFRELDNELTSTFLDPDYREGFFQELAKLDTLISTLFGPSFRIADIESSQKKFKINYFPMSSQQVRLIFNHYFTEFYYDIGHASDDYLKIRAIAKLIQRLELLHSVIDGCGRLDTAILNYLLTIYGFHPVILEYPYRSSSRNLDEWTNYLIQGLENWENIAPKASTDVDFALDLLD